MTAKIGESLKRIVDVVREPGGVRGGEFALSNLNRLAAYQAILELVMARSGTVSRSSGSTRKATLWHLSVLVESGFVDRWNFDRAIFYSPASAVPDNRTAGLLGLVSGKAETGILWAAMTRPGSSAARLSKPSVAELADAELVSLVGDGKVNRLYPGIGLKALSEKLDRGYEAHKSLLMRLCHQSAVKYQANPLKDGSLDYNLLTHSADCNFTVTAKPLENSLTRRAKLYNIL